ncbi:MAG: DUF4344 domain-containing metallopeptidase [Marmoricola sp.]
MRLTGLGAAALALALLPALSSCGSSSPHASAKPDKTPTAKAHAITVTFDDPVAGTDDGYVGAIATQENISPQALSEEILKDGEVEGVADGFSKSFEIPTDLQVHLSSEQGSPHYDPATRTVTIYYDFAALTGDIIKASQPSISDDDLGKQWAAVNDFVLVHELAHAFVDVLDIPVTGREEDAADGMATFFFTDFVPHGAEYAFAAAHFFAALQDYQGSPDAAQFADEHSLSIQRAGDIACKVAGSSEDNMNAIAQLGVLPDARLARCPDEYKQMSDAWRALLKPHLRKS